MIARVLRKKAEMKETDFEFQPLQKIKLNVAVRSLFYMPTISKVDTGS